MSAKLSSKLRRRTHKPVEATETAEPQHAHKPKLNWKMLVLLPLWVAVAYLVSNVIVSVVILVMSWLNMPIEALLRPAVLQTVLATVIYALTIAIVIGVPYWWRRTTTLRELGLHRMPSWTDIGLAPVGFVVYSLLTAAALAVVTLWLPSVPLDQAQDIGFNTLGSRSDNILAFVTLVVLAPIAEETLFRGYLYGKLKRYVPVFWAALVTSLLFALAHGQLNVGIDVFILSMVLCGLRSLTGSIWVCVLVHMIKNAIAYYILFVSPLLGG